MTAAEIVRRVELAGARLEPRGEHVWCSDPVLAGQLLQEVKANRDEVLLFLRRREYGRLKESADTLARFLDDTETNLETRRPRLPEYEELLTQIAELESYLSRGCAK